MTSSQKAASQVGPASPGVALAAIIGIVLKHWHSLSLSDQDVTAITASLATVFSFVIHWALPGVGGP